jgi:WD40 repeat protein
MLSVLDLQNGQRVQSLRGHSDWVRAVAYSPTGDLLASAGHDGRIVLWESRTGTALGEVSLPFAISALAFDQEASRLFVVGFGDRLQILDVSPRQWLSPWKCPSSDMRALACCAERGVVAAGGRNGLVRVWNTDGRVLQEYAAHRQRVWGLTFSADGRYLVSCGEDGTVRVSRLGAQEDFVLEIPGSKVMSVVFCGPDELATGGSDNRIHIWNLPRRQETAVLSGHTGSIAALASRGEILVSAGFDTTVRVWTRSGKLADR